MLHVKIPPDPERGTTPHGANGVVSFGELIRQSRHRTYYRDGRYRCVECSSSCGKANLMRWLKTDCVPPEGTTATTGKVTVMQLGKTPVYVGGRYRMRPTACCTPAVLHSAATAERMDPSGSANWEEHARPPLPQDCLSSAALLKASTPNIMGNGLSLMR